MLDPRLEKAIHRQLASVDDGGARGTRLLDDARRLCGRLHRFVSLGMAAGAEVDLPALELACHALQLPLRLGRPQPASGRSPGQLGLRERCEQAAELLANIVTDPADASLLDRATRVLREVPQKSATTPEPRLLADALNLDDFGLTGLVVQAMQLGRQNASVSQLADGYAKRREYGYWEARLKDGFHFEAVREMARARLKNVDAAVGLLAEELRADQG